jgi:flagellar biosynthetic protein FliR
MLGLATQSMMGIPGLDLQYVMDALLHFFITGLRLGAFLLSSPIFGAKWMPLKVRTIFVICVAVALSEQVPPIEASFLGTPAGFMMMATEIIIGLGAGITLTIWFSAMVLAGEKIASTAGLGFATLSDPNSGGSTPVVSQMMQLLLLVIFLSVDGHLMAIAMILDSYQTLPVGQSIDINILIDTGISAAGSMFKVATMIMFPIIIVQLLVNAAIGIITRSAPQLNLFSFGFPITLMVVFLVLYMSAGVLGASSRSLIDNALFAMQGLLTGLAYG